MKHLIQDEAALDEAKILHAEEVLLEEEILLAGEILHVQMLQMQQSGSLLEWSKILLQFLNAGSVVQI